MEILVIGAGYVGLSIATMLSINNKVSIIDIDKNKTTKINKRINPIKDDMISYYFQNKKLNLKCFYNYNDINKFDYAFICTPTNYDQINNTLNTDSITNTINELEKINKKGVIIIKSTIPVGYMDSIKNKYKNTLLFSPEFLRECSSLHDLLNPDRIIISPNNIYAKNYSIFIKKYIEKKDTPILFMECKEAESVKLFSNAYLALRISFFNELDNFAISNNLNTSDIIKGVSLDNRIGDYYNNPSFGFGGYCLPKDTLQLENLYEKIPNAIIKNIIKSNNIRKQFIISEILKTNKKNIGIYKLEMKKNSDNHRTSSMIDIIKLLDNANKKLYLYDPNITKFDYKNITLCNDLKEFKKISEIIVTNRMNEDLLDVLYKVYTRDTFNIN